MKRKNLTARVILFRCECVYVMNVLCEFTVFSGHINESTRVPKKTCDYIFYNNFNNRCPITIIFGTVSSKSMCHRKMVSFPTSPI